MKATDFCELRQPMENPHGWYISTVDHLQFQYLHPDLLLHEDTGGISSKAFPGYFSSESEAMIVRGKYYALHSNNNHDTAYDAAMAGI